MPRIDELPEYRAKLPKNVHDLSHKFGFTATVAHLLPVFHDYLNAGETVELGFNYNLRTQPLQSAAMVDIKSHVEYFFVPMQLLYEPFSSFLYGIDDLYSSNFPVNNGNQIVQDTLPVLDFTALNTEMQSYDTDVIYFEEWMNHAYRLMDHIGYNNTDLNHILGNTNHNPNEFPYPLLAYQCIYQYYYRLDNRERFNQSVFNWDKYYNTPVVTLNTTGYQNLFQLHYRPKDSDYFTDVKVSPIVDVLNLNVKSSFAVANNWLSRENSVAANRPVVTSGSQGTIGSAQSDSPTGLFSGNVPSSNIQTNFGFGGYESNLPSYVNGMDINTANIRAMFASEKLWSITGRARKNYDDQTLAHFGFEVPHDPKHEITCFGHDRGLIHIGEVISTADTANAALGEIAGKGYGSLQTKPHKFTAPCHGVVMAILSFVPDVTYCDTYGKYNVMSTRADIYQPEYDHLGMQPLFGYEGTISDYANWTDIVGWQYRYEQWKRRFNRVSKAFGGNGSLDSWMLDFHAPQHSNVPNVPRFYYYLHDPSELNQIMLVNYIYTAQIDETKSYDGDPFVVDSFIYCKKVSTMSDYSLPRLDA